MVLKEVGYENTDLTRLAEDQDAMGGIVNTTSINGGEFTD
jgi:hypothetical protein